MENDGLGIVIEDSKHGFMKGYRNGVLYYVDVFRKEVLFSEVKSYFNLGFWLERGKKSHKMVEVLKEQLRSASK